MLQASARLRLAALWVSQAGHFLANYSLRIFAVLVVASAGARQSDAAWHVVTALFMLPSIVLVPLYGAVGNSLPKRSVLVGAALWCLATTVFFGLHQSGWLACVALVALGSAAYVPTRFAMLPAAARDAGWPLQRVLAGVEACSVLCMVGGIAAGGTLFAYEWSGTPWGALCVPVTLAFVVLCHAVSVVFAVPTNFVSDVRRAESWRPALAGFFRDCRRIWSLGSARAALVGLMLLRGLVAVAAGAFIADALETHADPLAQVLLIGAIIMLGAAVGAGLAGLFRDHERSLRMIPPAVTTLAAILAWSAATGTTTWHACFVVGVLTAFVNVPALAVYQESLPADARGNGMALLNTAGYISMSSFSLLVAAMSGVGLIDARGQMWFVAVLTGLAGTATWLSGPSGARGGQTPVRSGKPAPRSPETAVERDGHQTV